MAGMDRESRAAAFRALHAGPEPLLLVNAWDVPSAQTIAGAFPAVATSSWAVAASRGYADGQTLPFDQVLDLVQRLSVTLAVPLSVDLEAGYGDTEDAVAESIHQVADGGAVGVNLEDGLVKGRRELAPAEAHAAKIEAARRRLSSAGLDLFINARIDTFLQHKGCAPPVEETLRRIEAYAGAGADGIFVPGVTDPQTVALLARATSLPLNVMLTPAAPAISVLADAGARRISFGGWPFSASLRGFAGMAAAIASSRSGEPFAAPAG